MPPLGVPGADADLVAINQAEAVRLFAERAAAVKPDFVVTAENAAPVAAVAAAGWDRAGDRARGGPPGCDDPGRTG